MDRWAKLESDGEARYPCDTCSGFRVLGRPCSSCSGARAELERLRERVRVLDRLLDWATEYVEHGAACATRCGNKCDCGLTDLMAEYSAALAPPAAEPPKCGERYAPNAAPFMDQICGEPTGHAGAHHSANVSWLRAEPTPAEPPKCNYHRDPHPACPECRGDPPFAAAPQQQKPDKK